MLPQEDDLLSPENLVQENIKHFCHLYRFAAELGQPIAPAKVTTGNITHIDGLACATNSSLYMIAVDSVENYHFPEALGIDITKKKDMTAVVILDSRVSLFREFLLISSTNRLHINHTIPSKFIY